MSLRESRLSSPIAFIRVSLFQLVQFLFDVLLRWGDTKPQAAVLQSGRAPAEQRLDREHLIQLHIRLKPALLEPLSHRGKDFAEV